MTSDGNGYGSGPDETPRYGVRVPGGSPNPQGSEGTPVDGENRAGHTSSDIGPQPTGWDQPRENQTFGPYVPDAPQGQGAPAQPGYGQGYPGQPTPARRPGQVTAASIILWIAAGLYTVFVAASMLIVMSNGLRSMLEESYEALPAEQADVYRDLFDSIPDSTLQGSIIFAIVMIVAIGALAAVAAWRTWKGSNAWRIAGTVCGAAMAAYQLFMMLASPVLGLPGLAVCIIVIVLWYSKPASAWFRSHTPRRR